MQPALMVSSPKYTCHSPSKIIVFFSPSTFKVQTSYSLNQVWLSPELKVKLNVSHSHSVYFLIPSSVNLPLSCIHKTFLNTLAAFCVSAGWRLTQALLDWGREKGGYREGNEVQAVHLFSVEAVAESTAVGVCCWAVGEDQEVFVATVHEQGPLTASFDVVGPCRRLALCAGVTVIAGWVTVNASTYKRGEDRHSWGLIMARPGQGCHSHTLWSCGIFCTPL